MDELGQITEHLLRFSPDGLIVVDDQGIIRFANETTYELFGYEPTTLIGRNMEVLVPERLRTRHAEHVANFLVKPSKRAMGARVAALAARRADGSEFSAGIRLAPFHINGKLYVAAAIRDITERQRINEALIAAREEADRANRAKSRFLATASHDLRQPLQTIRLLNAAMFKIVKTNEMRGLLSQQQHAIDTMTRLLNALLDISRLESGAIEPKPVPVSIMELFEELEAEFSAAARARGLVLEFDPAPAVICTDRTLFYQLLQNLIGNALKYTDRGTVNVACVSDADGVIVSVTDTGIGIPADKLERIFDEYYQVDTHGAKRVGVGLGLAIVREVARILGISVNVSSQVGQGTQVRVVIPPKSVLSATAPPQAEDEEHVRVTNNATTRLILVEDNESVRAATELFLKLEGYEVQSAGSVAEAEPFFAKLRPGDVVIADHHLDEKRTGLDMLIELRQRFGYTVPGIILSGDLPSVLRSMRSAVPACVFLGKPVDTDALVQTIEELANASRREHGGSVEQLARSQAS